MPCRALLQGQGVDLPANGRGRPEAGRAQGLLGTQLLRERCCWPLARPPGAPSTPGTPPEGGFGSGITLFPLVRDLTAAGGASSKPAGWREMDGHSRRLGDPGWGGEQRRSRDCSCPDTPVRASHQADTGRGGPSPWVGHRPSPKKNGHSTGVPPAACRHSQVVWLYSSGGRGAGDKVQRDSLDRALCLEVPAGRSDCSRPVPAMDTPNTLPCGQRWEDPGATF